MKTRSKTPLFEMVRIDPIRVVFDMPAAHVTNVKKGMPVTIRRVPGRNGLELPAKIARIGATLDPVSRTFRVEADLPNPEDKLRPGMYGMAVISVDAEADSSAENQGDSERIEDIRVGDVETTRERRNSEPHQQASRDSQQVDPRAENRLKLTQDGFKTAMDEFKASEANLESVRAWSLRILEAQRELREDPAEIRRAHLDRMTTLLNLVGDLYKAGQAKRSAVLDAQFVKMEAESLLAEVSAPNPQ